MKTAETPTKHTQDTHKVDPARVEAARKAAATRRKNERAQLKARKAAALKATEKRQRGLDELTKLQRDQLADALALMNMPQHDKLQVAYAISDACNLKGDERREFYDSAARMMDSRMNTERPEEKVG